MIQYTKCGLYIDSQTTLAGKIAALDNIINTLMSTAASAAGNQDLMEYSFNDGQTIVKMIYRDSASVFRAIEDYTKLREIYINQINGRMVRLVDSKNFVRRYNFVNGRY